MLKQTMKSITSYLDERIIHPDDPADVRLGKRVFIWIALVTIPLGLIGTLFGLFGDSPRMMTIGLFSAVVFPLNFFMLLRTRRFTLHFSIWSLGVMALMVAWGMLLGGFKANFGVYWTVFLPLVLVILIEPQRRTIGWFLVFSIFTVAFGMLEPYADIPENAPTNVAFANTYTVVAGAGMVMLTLSYYRREKNTALRLLGLERERADSLLLNILPQKIADILKVEEGTIADYHGSASILFADLVGFTPLSAQMTPTEMIELLNTIYSHFDSLAEKHGVEKIRTIGDNYMVASGVPSSRPDHAQALANMALDMLDFSNSLPAQNGNTIQFRIGINSGPLVAGVIGKKRFHYDVWGDTVNTASRMESQGLAGEIQITANTRQLIKDEFVCEKRGMMDIKGIGEMETWLLVGRDESVSSRQIDKNA